MESIHRWIDGLEWVKSDDLRTYQTEMIISKNPPISIFSLISRNNPPTALSFQHWQWRVHVVSDGEEIEVAQGWSCDIMAVLDLNKAIIEDIYLGYP